MNGVWNQSPADTVTSAPKCSTILETCHVDDDSGNGIGCHCGWPNHTKNMTGCDSLPGSVKWYHLLCVGIDRKKKEGTRGKMAVSSLREKSNCQNLNPNPKG